MSRIHLVGEHLEVSLNVLRWNEEVGREPGRSLWGRRAVKYFVHDPISGLFAPSKFAAFLAVVPSEGQVAHMATMNVALYATLDESEPKFDGHVARRHLVERLAMTETRGRDEGELWRAFDTWATWNREVLTVRSDGPTILSPPSWYAG